MLTTLIFLLRLVRSTLFSSIFDRTGGPDAPNGGWSPGTIIRVWDEGNPYRVELDDADRTNVWGPKDDDSFIREGNKKAKN